jgi:hypothetical protein
MTQKGKVIPDIKALSDFMPWWPKKGDWVMSAYLNIRIPEWLDKICVSPLLLYRRLKYGEPFRKIYLGEGAYTTVDTDVYYQKNRYKWFLAGNGINVYPLREKIVGPKKTIRSSLHREIIKARKGMLIDHSDNNTLNNLRSNLRQATYSQNAMNRPKTKSKTSSKYRGVSWNKGHKKFQVRIEWEHNGRRNRKTIGYFDREKEVEAGRAYDCSALKYHGEFARLNFPRENYVKAGNSYKFAGKPAPAENPGTLADKLNNIYLSIRKRFVKQN